VPDRAIHPLGQFHHFKRPFGGNEAAPFRGQHFESEMILEPP
jgi:hypothetical protein